MTSSPWNEARDMIQPVVDGLPIPDEVKAQFRTVLADLVDECEQLEDRSERVDEWAKVNAYRPKPDWYGLAAILREASPRDTP